MVNMINFHTIALAFIEGLGLILSPCILPILPIVLATGIQGGKARPYGIITGFIISFVSFTLLSRKIVGSFNIDQELLQNISLTLLAILAIILFSDKLSEKFNLRMQKFANMGTTLSQFSISSPLSGYASGLLIGITIAFIWTPCAGPIMASILVQTIQQKSDVDATVTLLAFSMGVGLPMLLMTIFGNRLLKTQRSLTPYLGMIRKFMAILIIIAVVFTKLNVWTTIFLKTASIDQSPALPAVNLINGITNPVKAPELIGIDHWLNSKPLTLTSLTEQKKVVLIDFWTYSCINCVRTLPYLKEWHRKYADKGLVIIGVHTPEFPFEKNIDNIKKAVQSEGVTYPVVVDNHQETWLAFNNMYWPAHYLIDKQGDIVYTHFGEGSYDITENNIRYLLGLDTMPSKTSTNAEDLKIQFNRQSPETYLGIDRTQNFESRENMILDKEMNFTYPSSLPLDSWALSGLWEIHNDHIIAKNSNSRLKFNFQGKKVYLVMSSPQANQPITVKIYLNGQPVAKYGGKDVFDNQITVKNSTLYELINLHDQSSGVVEIIPQTPGLEAYAFTFGSS